MKRNRFGIVGAYLPAVSLAVLLAFSVGLAGCSLFKPAYRSVDTSVITEQIRTIKIHEVKPGEAVKELEIERTGSLQVDFNKYQGGSWYSTHKDKIVAIEALEKHEAVPLPKVTQIWRIQYID